MPVFKATHLFDSTVRNTGWSETWYVEANDFTDATQKGFNIATARLQMLEMGYTLHYMRVSANVPMIPKPPRRTRAAGLTNLSLQGNGGGGPFGIDPDLAWTAALLRVSDATLAVFRNFLLRGIPDNLWSGGSDKIAKAFFAQKLGPFAVALQAAQAVILHKQQVPPPLNPVFIKTIQFERMARRATGRPFGLDRGRR
jgi:hypothetical protein